MMLTPKTVAERLGVSTSLVYRLCQEGALRHFRMGAIGKRGKLLIDEEDVSAFLDSCRRETGRVDASFTLNHIRLS